MVIYLGLIDTSPKKLKYKNERLKMEEKEKHERDFWILNLFLVHCGGPIIKISLGF